MSRYNTEELTSLGPGEDQIYDDGKCAICMDEYNDRSTLPCGHVFCLTCLQKWHEITKKCPTCRHPFQTFRHNIKPEYTQTTPKIISVTVTRDFERNGQSWTTRMDGRADPVVIQMDPLGDEKFYSCRGCRRRFFLLLGERLGGHVRYNLTLFKKNNNIYNYKKSSVRNKT